MPPEHIEVKGQMVPYSIRRSGRAKYIQMRILPGTGLELILPKRASLKEGRRFIESRREWIASRLNLLVKPKADYRYLGRELHVIHRYQLFLPRHHVLLKKEKLFINSPEGSGETTEEIFEAFLKFKAKQFLVDRTRELASEHGFKIGRVTIRGQKTRWGSCSAKRSISLNYQLIKFRQELIDYVIIHELCHTRHMNHSKAFWNEVAKYTPDYKRLRAELRSTAV